MTEDWEGLSFILEAVVTILFNMSFSFIVTDLDNTVTEHIRIHFITVLQNVSMICMVKLNKLKLFRKYSRCWACVAILSTVSFHLRLLEIVKPRHVKCWTISTVPPSIKRGEREKTSFSYSSQSFRLFTLSSRLLSLHQLISLFTIPFYTYSCT